MGEPMGSLRDAFARHQRLLDNTLAEEQGSDTMKVNWIVTSGVTLATMGILYMAASLRAEPPDATPGESSEKKAAKAVAKVDDSKRVAIEVARDRAKVMHEIYEATLDVMHHRYFHRERSVVPARAMEDVFLQIKRQSHVEARWISVNLKPMSIDHEPTSDFEKQAAREIAAGKLELESVEDGYYRRAGVIPLSAGCVGCHAGLSKEANQSPKYAALVISVPVLTDPGKAE